VVPLWHTYTPPRSCESRRNNQNDCTGLAHAANRFVTAQRCEQDRLACFVESPTRDSCAVIPRRGSIRDAIVVTGDTPNRVIRQTFTSDNACPHARIASTEFSRKRCRYTSCIRAGNISRNPIPGASEPSESDALQLDSFPVDPIGAPSDLPKSRRA